MKRLTKGTRTLYKVIFLEIEVDTYCERIIFFALHLVHRMKIHSMPVPDSFLSDTQCFKVSDIGFNDIWI
jgi:hypothetical protein